MGALIRYILLTSYRSRMMGGLVAALAAVAGVSAFIGHTALVEHAQTGVALAGGGMRWVLAAGVVLLGCFATRQMYASREILWLASLPLSRVRLVLGLMGGFGILATVLAALAGLLLALMAPPEGAPALFFVSLWGEALMLTALSVALGLMFQSAVTAAMGALGFYVLARLSILLVGAAEAGASLSPGWLDYANYYVLSGIGLLLPRLDMFGKTEWLVYGADPERLLPLLAQTVIYAGLLSVMAVVDFRRKAL